MHSELYPFIITFPFEQLGLGLRKLSLSGAAGNIAAIIIYVLISLIPCLIFFLLKKSGKLLKTDYFLPVISILLFAVIYYMINPGSFHANIPGAGKILLVCTFHSVFFGYIILRVLEKCRLTDTKRLQTWLKPLLAAIIFLCLYAILTECVKNLSVSIRYLHETDSLENSMINGMTGASLTATYVFLILQCVTNALPYILAVFILFTVIRSLNTLILDRYSDASVAAVDRLVSLCTKSLVITVLSNMLFNILQLLFHQALQEINMVVSVPVFSIAFVLTVSLTAGYVRENQKLKQDNDLFI